VGSLLRSIGHPVLGNHREVGFKSSRSEQFVRDLETYCRGRALKAFIAGDVKAAFVVSARVVAVWQS